MQSLSTGSWGHFVLLTILNWGLYGLLLHTAQGHMGDPAFARYKAFFFVGVAYLVVAVMASAVILFLLGADWTFSTKGVVWALTAGTAGAVGAFGVLLAFGAKASPAVVMSLIFAGAPVVNAVATIAMHKLWAEIRWPFILGICLAAAGAFLVVTFKPTPQPHVHKSAPIQPG